MKIDRDKKIGLGFTILMMITAPISFYSHDTLKPTREQLMTFYSTEFNNDSIVSIVERKYPGKGNYYLFKVNSKIGYFPIILEKGNYDEYDLFKTGALISKKKDSYDLNLVYENNNYQLRIRNPKDEDDRMMGVYMPIGFFGLFFLIQLFLIPNSYYENRRNKKTAHNKTYTQCGLTR
jgi:hypothetical protein